MSGFAHKGSRRAPMLLAPRPRLALLPPATRCAPPRPGLRPRRPASQPPHRDPAETARAASRARRRA
eukprot:12150895-Alexandrium_andersonii.AAC.1